jgi:peroxiredoxin (alkyl hydroperoxide reductase subunit C)
MSLDWQPGDKVIIPALKTVKALAARKESDLELWASILPKNCYQ